MLRTEIKETRLQWIKKVSFNFIKKGKSKIYLFHIYVKHIRWISKNVNKAVTLIVIICFLIIIIFIFYNYFLIQW